jgi:hypothetical protein
MCARIHTRTRVASEMSGTCTYYPFGQSSQRLLADYALPHLPPPARTFPHEIWCMVRNYFIATLQTDIELTHKFTTALARFAGICRYTRQLIRNSCLLTNLSFRHSTCTATMRFLLNLRSPVTETVYVNLRHSSICWLGDCGCGDAFSTEHRREMLMACMSLAPDVIVDCPCGHAITIHNDRMRSLCLAINDSIADGCDVRAIASTSLQKLTFQGSRVTLIPPNPPSLATPVLRHLTLDGGGRISCDTLVSLLKWAPKSLDIFELDGFAIEFGDSQKHMDRVKIHSMQVYITASVEEKLRTITPSADRFRIEFASVLTVVGRAATVLHHVSQRIFGVAAEPPKSYHAPMDILPSTLEELRQMRWKWKQCDIPFIFQIAVDGAFVMLR